MLLLAGISYLWFLNTTRLSTEDNRNILLVNRAASEKVVADFIRESEGSIEVPTGVFIQSLEFVDANSIIMTGIIWQRYSEDASNWEIKPAPGEVIPIIFTKADLNYQEEVTEIYRTQEGNEEIIGWHVRAVLNQRFDFSDFPFDQEGVFIRMRHKEFDRGVILTPDLLSYTTTNPASIPGVERDDFFLAGWDVERSFFSFRENTYNTNFGVGNPEAEQESAELYFNVILSRRFIDPFVSHVIPIAVVILLLFAVLVIFSSRQDRLGVSGFSASGILGYCAALMFVVIIAHISLRSNLGAPQGIIYLEYIYFLTYGAILSVSLNAIVFAAAPGIRLFQYRDNLVSDLLFWPTFFTLLLIVTLVAIA